MTRITLTVMPDYGNGLNETGIAGASFDWESFHARGLELATRLKAEVGDTYRVIYEKPYEDPGVDERREVLADGRLIKLPVRETPP